MILPNFFCVFAFFVFHVISLYILFPSRFGKRKTCSIYGCVFVLCFVLCWWMLRRSTSFHNLCLVLMTTVFFGVTTSLFVSSYHKGKTVFLFMMYWQAFIINLTLAAFISQQCFAGSTLSATLACTLMHAVIVVLCVVFQEKKKMVMQGVDHGWWPLTVVEIVCFLYSSFIVLHIYGKRYVRMELILLLLFLILIVAVYIVCFHTIHYMHWAAKQEQEELRSNFLLEQMQEMKVSMEGIQRLLHDSRHHNLQILEYAKCGKIDTLLQYLGEYEREIESHVMMRFCENIAANSILCAYARKAEQHGINVLHDVVMEQDIGIKDLDIVAILANLMENAIHGCLLSESSEPQIEVYITRRSSKLVIFISNTVRCDVVVEKHLPRSKNGIGISSILHSAAQYGGEYDVQSNDGVYSCQLLLKIPVER